jgi:uncharacterized protein YciU (UPF0263 family)
MFKKINPQKVESSDGYTVQVADRNHVEYLETARKADVEVDFGITVGVYARTLRGWMDGSGLSPIKVSEKALVLKRIVAGLEAMGSKVELC